LIDLLLPSRRSLKLEAHMLRRLSAHGSRFFSRDFWLGSEGSAVNVNRFWLYLAAISVILCAVCLLRALEIHGNH
jgi:hypothetical protein